MTLKKKPMKNKRIDCYKTKSTYYFDTSRLHESDKIKGISLYIPSSSLPDHAHLEIECEIESKVSKNKGTVGVNRPGDPLSPNYPHY